MKHKHLLIVISLVVLSSCADKGFVLTGKLHSSVEGTRVYLKNMEDESIVIDSTIVHNGDFELRGQITYTGRHSLIFNMDTVDHEKPDYTNKVLRISFYPENTKMTFEGDAAVLPAFHYNPERTGDAIIYGSKSEDLYKTYKTETKKVKDELRETIDQYINEYVQPDMRGEDVTEKGILLVTQINELITKRNEKTIDFIKRNPSSAVSLDLLSGFINYYSNLSIEEIEENLTLLDEAWENSDRLHSLKVRASEVKSTAKGSPYMDIELLNLQGETVKLSSFVPNNRYTMLVFWASWCGPCRGEIPHLLKVKEKYPDLNIISISVDEKNDAWLRAVEEEKMHWTQLRNSAGQDGVIEEVYHIDRVPSCIMLDSEGKFIKSNLRGAYIDQLLLEAYGY